MNKEWLIPIGLMVIIAVLTFSPIIIFIIHHGFGYYITINGTYKIPMGGNVDVINGSICKVTGMVINTGNLICSNSSSLRGGDIIYGHATLYVHVDYYIIGIGIMVVIALTLLIISVSIFPKD